MHEGSLRLRRASSKHPVRETDITKVASIRVLGRLSRVARALISVGVSIGFLLFLYGYLTPIGLSPASVFGPSYSQLFGGDTTGGMTGLSGFGFGPLVPGGITGLLAYQVLSRFGSIASAATGPSMPSPDEMMRRMNIPGMMGGPGGMFGQASAPAALPTDMTRPQFVVLKSYRQGYKNAKEIGKALSMDKNEVEKETSALRSNGYLSKKNRLTSKAIEVLGS